MQFDTEPPEGQVKAEANKEVQTLQEGKPMSFWSVVTKSIVDQPPLALPVTVAPVLKCRVMLQKENPDGPPIDEECGNPVQGSHAGLCE